MPLVGTHMCCVSRNWFMKKVDCGEMPRIRFLLLGDCISVSS